MSTADVASEIAANESTPTNWGAVADFDIDAMTSNNSRFAEDAALHVLFYIKPSISQSASDAAKRPIYEDVEQVKIFTPGEKRSIVDRPATEIDISRFRLQYEKFKAGAEEQQSGTPLHFLPGLSASRVEEYKYSKILTVEQLAGASDSAGQAFMGFNADKRRAAAYLQLADARAPVAEVDERLSAENETLKLQLETLQKQIDSIVSTKKRAGKKTPEVETD